MNISYPYPIPPSIPNDDLIAKCSPRGAGNGGNVVWTSMYASYVNPAPGIPWHKSSGDMSKKPPMAYKMEHWASRKLFHRTIDSIVVTNLYCGVGKGWDIVVEGSIVQHEDTKTSAQREAETLLEGRM